MRLTRLNPPPSPPFPPSENTLAQRPGKETGEGGCGGGAGRIVQHRGIRAYACICHTLTGCVEVENGPCCLSRLFLAAVRSGADSGVDIARGCDGSSIKIPHTPPHTDVFSLLTPTLAAAGRSEVLRSLRQRPTGTKPKRTSSRHHRSPWWRETERA